MSIWVVVMVIFHASGELTATIDVSSSFETKEQCERTVEQIGFEVYADYKKKFPGDRISHPTCRESTLNRAPAPGQVRL